MLSKQQEPRPSYEVNQGFATQRLVPPASARSIGSHSLSSTAPAVLGGRLSVAEAAAAAAVTADTTAVVPPWLRRMSQEPVTPEPQRHASQVAPIASAAEELASLRQQLAETVLPEARDEEEANEIISAAATLAAQLSSDDQEEVEQSRRDIEGEIAELGLAGADALKYFFAATFGSCESAFDWMNFLKTDVVSRVMFDTAFALLKLDCQKVTGMSQAAMYAKMAKLGGSSITKAGFVEFLDRGTVDQEDLKAFVKKHRPRLRADAAEAAAAAQQQLAAARDSRRKLPSTGGDSAAAAAAAAGARGRASQSAGGACKRESILAGGTAAGAGAGGIGGAGSADAAGADKASGSSVGSKQRRSAVKGPSAVGEDSQRAAEAAENAVGSKQRRSAVKRPTAVGEDTQRAADAAAKAAGQSCDAGESFDKLPRPAGAGGEGAGDGVAPEAGGDGSPSGRRRKTGVYDDGDGEAPRLPRQWARDPPENFDADVCTEVCAQVFKEVAKGLPILRKRDLAKLEATLQEIVWQMEIEGFVFKGSIWKKVGLDSAFDETLQLQLDMGSAYSHGIELKYFKVLIANISRSMGWQMARLVWHLTNELEFSRATAA